MFPRDALHPGKCWKCNRVRGAQPPTGKGYPHRRGWLAQLHPTRRAGGSGWAWGSGWGSRRGWEQRLRHVRDLREPFLPVNVVVIRELRLGDHAIAITVERLEGDVVLHDRRFDPLVLLDPRDLRLGVLILCRAALDLVLPETGGDEEAQHGCENNDAEARHQQQREPRLRYVTHNLRLIR